MIAEPTKEHAWLKRFVGEWTMQGECVMEPGKPPAKSSGRERVRMLGDLWIVGESTMELPGGGGTMDAILTLGFNPATGKFIGSWVGGCMPTMFVYEGELDQAQRVLPLNTSGPSFSDPTRLARYQDVVELHSDNKRLLWSQCQDEKGAWQRFMSATYTRVK